MDGSSKWNLWSLYWLFWLVVGFGVPETIALIRGKGDTLSNNVWKLTEVNAPYPWTFLHYLIGVLTLWLFFHMTFGWFK